MPRDDRGNASGGTPPPHDGLDPTEVLAHAHATARDGHGPPPSAARGAARRLGLDAVTLNMLTHDDRLELLWCDPAKGLGPELDGLQCALGDGPAFEVVQQGRPLTEPDLSAADPARWPLFLPAAARTPLRAVIAAPLRLGAATVGVLTGYRVAPGPLTPAQLRDLDRLGRALLLLLRAELADPADDIGPGTGLRLYRAEVHQATGFLSSALGVPLWQALLLLRARAVAHDQPLSDLARTLLTRSLSPDAFTTAT
ncbi:GAF and ANTAR domain-containing protein [Streptomyces sp. NPDC050617]|uniref:GAF and ANTAR domain-containing protein n=1 Tax=Streptomyces sp. NPDC050617 TaxID=3154628 RepID=UPI00341528F0